MRKDTFDPRFLDAKTVEEDRLGLPRSRNRLPLFLEKSGEKIVAVENRPAVSSAHTLQSPNSSRRSGTQTADFVTRVSRETATEIFQGDKTQLSCTIGTGSAALQKLRGNVQKPHQRLTELPRLSPSLVG